MLNQASAGFVSRRSIAMQVAVCVGAGLVSWAAISSLGPDEGHGHLTLQLSTALLAGLCVALALLGRRRAKALAAMQAAQRRLKSVIDHLAEGVAIADADGRFILWNQSAVDMHGFTVAAQMGADPQAFRGRFELRGLDGAVLPFEQWPVMRLIRGLPVENLEVVLRRVTDGRERVVRYNGARVPDDSGRDLLLLSFADVTAAHAQAHSLRLSRALIDRSSDGIEVVDPQTGRFVDVNQAMCARLGYSKEELLSKTVFDVVEVRREDWPALVEKVRSEGTLNGAGRHIRRDGVKIPIEYSAAWVRLDRGEYLVAIARDVSARQAVEEKLRRQERLLQQMGRLAKVGGWAFDPATGEGEWTPEVARIHDLDPADGTSMQLGLQFYPGEAKARIEAAVQEGIAHGTPYDLELPFVSAKGANKWVRTICEPLVEHGHVVSMRGAFMDITDRKEAENLSGMLQTATRILAESRSVAEATERLLALICASLDWDLGELWTVDSVDRSLRCTQSHSAPGAALGGFAQASRALSFAPGEQLPERVWASTEPFWAVDVCAHPDFRRKALAQQAGLRGAVAIPVRFEGRMLGVLVFLDDAPRPPDARATEAFASIGSQLGQFIARQRLEEQVRQTQKMEALGTLAGGIAHDFNNILTGILGHASLLRGEVEDQPVLREDVDGIVSAASRAADLVEQILAFSRAQETARALIRLEEVVQESCKLLRASIPTTIELLPSFESDTPPILANVAQVHQVVVNVCTNAAHAMRGGPGRIELLVEGCEVDEAQVAMHAGLRAGRFTRLSVRDTGHGMDAETQQRIFEPFFTTKGPHEGTGLGLAVVHGVMQAHEGVVVVYSQPDQGTRLDLYFPSAEGEPVPEPVAVAQAPVRGSGERILLIDDEVTIAELGKRQLERLGYVVESVVDAEEGWQAFAASPERFDVVITDLTMPGATGIELAQRMTQLRPDITVILTTGYSGTLTPEAARAAGVHTVLYKPLSVDRLNEAVQLALHGNGAPR